MDATFT